METFTPPTIFEIEEFVNADQKYIPHEDQSRSRYYQNEGIPEKSFDAQEAIFLRDSSRLMTGEAIQTTQISLRTSMQHAILVGTDTKRESPRGDRSILPKGFDPRIAIGLPTFEFHFSAHQAHS